MVSIIQKVKAFVVDNATFSYFKIFKSSRTFRWNGREYHYFYHWYNFTWRNERAIEVALFLEAVKNNQKRRILEVGNVLSHYVSITHDVVDKYEKAHGVINEDIVSIKPKKRYDLIISISTLEHVGFNETPQEKTKGIKALKHLQQLLTPSGKIMISLPLGYNPSIDRFLARNRNMLPTLPFFKRITSDNAWRQASWEEVKKATYNSPFPNANAISLLFLDRKTKI